MRSSQGFKEVDTRENRTAPNLNRSYRQIGIAILAYERLSVIVDAK